MLQIGIQLLDEVKDETPHVTGYLQDHWELGKVERVGDEWIIEVYNNTEYAAAVEYGRRKRKTSADSKDTLIPGKHMLRLSIDKVQRQLPGFLEDWLSRFLDTHEIF